MQGEREFAVEYELLGNALMPGKNQAPARVEQRTDLLRVLEGLAAREEAMPA
jgi:hypothetical protein